MELKYESEDVHQALAHLVEELGEAIQAAGKSQRWGLLSYNPELGPASEKNVEWLLRELRDVEVSIAVLRAFLKASYNDNQDTWSYLVPENIS